MFLGGPPLVQMATGEVTDAESLGGADMHSRISGLSDQLAMDEYDAISKARDWIANLNWEQKGKLPLRHLTGEYEEPYYDAGKFKVIKAKSTKAKCLSFTLHRRASWYCFCKHSHSIRCYRGYYPYCRWL